MPNLTIDTTDPALLGNQGRQIYSRRYKSEYEGKYNGQFAAIDLTTEKAYLGDTSDSAYEAARRDAPNGFFYLIQIGSDWVERVF